MSKNVGKLLLVIGVAVIGITMIALAPAQGNVQAAQGTPTPEPFTAKVSVVAIYPRMGELGTNGRNQGINIPRDPKEPLNANKATYFTLSSTGGSNVPPGLPVYVQAGATGTAEGAKLAKYDWTVKGPSGSKAAIKPVVKKDLKMVKVKDPKDATKEIDWADRIQDADTLQLGLSLDMAVFTPDVEGEYVVGLTVTDDKGAKSVPVEFKVVAQKYAGSEACKGCHAEAYEGWSKSVHGTMFQRFVDMNVEAEYYVAGGRCSSCHNTGYTPVKGTGGWWDVFVNEYKLDWLNNSPLTVTKGDTKTDYKTFKEAIALNGFPDAGANWVTYASIAAQYPKLAAVSNVGCEQCHGPASAHAKSPGPATAPFASGDSNSCDQCHRATGGHSRGNAVANSAHGKNAELEEGERADCARCHSPKGYISATRMDLAANPGDALDPTKIVAENENIGCPACHDPHVGEENQNAFILRSVGKVVIPISFATQADPKKWESFTVEDAGLSAACMFCHNVRREGQTSLNPEATSIRSITPHPPNQTELLLGRGGVDFGFKIRNSFHVNIGKGVVTDDAGNAAHDGEVPGPCVLCHMTTTPGGPGDGGAKAPGHELIGGHAFAMATEVDGKPVELVAACQSCHPGLTSFDIPAEDDLDGNGKVESVQTELKGLKEAVKKAVLAADKNFTFDDKAGTFVPAKDLDFTKVKAEVKGAIYNWAFCNTGGAAVHNLAYCAGLLQASVEKLTGKALANADLMYSK